MNGLHAVLRIGCCHSLEQGLVPVRVLNLPMKMDLLAKLSDDRGKSISPDVAHSYCKLD